MGEFAAKIVAEGLATPEGPVVLPDGSIVFVEQEKGRVSRWSDGVVTKIASGPGAWNAVTLGSDGNLYGAQNGGVVGPWRAEVPGVPGVERIGLDGSVSPVASTVGGVKCLAPNDLAFGPDGRLYFTDPSHPYDPDLRGVGGRLFAIGGGGSGEAGGEVVVEVGPVYCNGIGFVGGNLYWVESYERHVCKLGADGERVVVCQLPHEHVPDGFAVSTDGRMFISSVTSHGVSMITAAGEYLGLIQLDDGAIPTNCCFQGSTLFVTDFGPRYFGGDSSRGRLWQVETDAVGVPLHQGSV